MLIPEIKQERLYQKIANLIIKLINDNVFRQVVFYLQSVSWRNNWELVVHRWEKLLLFLRYLAGLLFSLVMGLLSVIINTLQSITLSKKFFMSVI